MTSISKILGVVGVGMMLPLAASAQSAKATAKVADLSVVTQTETWVPVLKQTIKTANMKDLFISPSLETTLFTQTKVSSKNGTQESSTAEAGIKLRVKINGVSVYPGNEGVTYNRRKQTLTATFQGIIDGCLSVVDGVVVLDPDCVLPEEVELILDTTSAHTFNFVAADIPQGTHEVVVEAKIDTAVSGTAGGSQTARAVLGHGSVTVESVRMVRNEDVIDL